nr:ribosome maturation factor RimM [Arsenicicoccus piscis]
MRTVARIGKPHGLRGEVTVQLHTDDPQTRLADGAVLQTLSAPGSGVPRRLTIRSTRVHQGIWLVAFEEIPDRTGAGSLRGTRLQVEVEQEPEHDADDDGFYEHELVGLAVEDPAGAAVGEVIALHTRPAQDLLEVRRADGRTALVPFVEALVPVVDVDGGRVVVDAPAGLFDLED